MPKECAAILSLCILCLPGTAGADHSLIGQSGVPYSAPRLRPETLYQGDLIPERGIGCSDASGTYGGPNDLAVGVTATMTPPFFVTSHWYNIYTQVSPTITALSFVCWAGFAEPGVEIGRVAGLPWSQGGHTAAISPAIQISDPWFFFGQSQPQTNAGMRWGLDTSSSAGTSYIRAPNCGVSEFITIDALGFPGNWCMAVTVEPMFSPVELQSWGEIKSAFR